MLSIVTRCFQNFQNSPSPLKKECQNLHMSPGQIKFKVLTSNPLFAKKYIVSNLYSFLVAYLKNFQYIPLYILLK